MDSYLFWCVAIVVAGGAIVGAAAMVWWIDGKGGRK